MIITITGNPGSGKSTVGKILAQKLNLKRYYMGQILRDLAKERGTDIDGLMEMAKINPSIDKDIDEYQRNIGNTEDDILVEGRMSFHFIPQSIKIYIKVDFLEAAKRIIKDIKENSTARNESFSDNLDEQKKKLIERHERDRFRYKKYYNINMDDMTNYDIVIDSTNKSIEEVVKLVIKGIDSIKSSVAQ